MKIYPPIKISLALIASILMVISCSEGPTNGKMEWDVANFGHGPAYGFGFTGITISALREDGINRIYLAQNYYTAEIGGSYKSEILEYEYENSQWNGKVIFSGESNQFNIENLTIGEGRNDGLKRIYFTNEFSSGGLHELTYLNGDWEMITIDPSPGIISGLAINPGRNDGESRVYGFDNTGDIFEYTFVNTTWEKSNLSSTDEERFNDMAIGSVRNDGVTRVYMVNYEGQIYEYTYLDSGWDVSFLGTVKITSLSFAVNKIFMTVGYVRSDEIERLYVSSPTLYEFSYNGEGFWEKDSFAAGIGEGELTIGEGRNDGVFRVYIAGVTSHLAEISFFENKWSLTAELRGESSFLGFLWVAVGPGRGDGVNRVYGLSRDGFVYEFSIQH